jgi:hypothetical protein
MRIYYTFWPLNLGNFSVTGGDRAHNEVEESIKAQHAHTRGPQSEQGINSCPTRLVLVFLPLARTKRDSYYVYLAF